MKLLNQIAAAANTVLMVFAAMAAAVMLASGLYVLNDIYYTNRTAFVSHDLLQYRPKLRENPQTEDYTYSELRQINPDTVGWIEMFGTNINYPVVQGTDNQYYLHHAPDGSENILGTIFLSYQCAPDFSDDLNILYGHNMQSGMFGDIRRFKEQDEFVSHRYGWLLTKEALFRIDFYALAIISAYDELYDIPADSSAWQEALRARSMHYTETEPAADLPVLALSTCAVDFGDARALFTGRLVHIRGISPADTA